MGIAVGLLDARLRYHVLALGMLLATLVVLTHNGAVVSADEGAVLAQARILQQSGQWSMGNRFEAVDPRGEWFGIDISDTNGRRWFPYAKHPLYPEIARWAGAAGGQLGVELVSAAGTVVAAAAAALVARRLRPAAPVPHLDLFTLWGVGVLSPLFFDGFWAIAHSLGAAAATAALLTAIRARDALDERADGRAVGWSAAMAVALAVCVLLRSEGMLWGLALSGAIAVGSAGRRRVPSLAVAAAAASTTVGAWWLDGRWHGSVIGTPIAPFHIRGASGGFVADRLRGVWASVLRPQLLDSTPAGTIALVVAVLVVAVAAYVRWRPLETTLIVGLSGLAATGAVVLLFLPHAPLPGLLIGCPILGGAVVLFRWRTLVADPVAKIILVTSGLFALAVVSTQYPVGGSMEWAGRFFHLMLPSLAPVVIATVLIAGRSIGVGVRTGDTGAVVRGAIGAPTATGTATGPRRTVARLLVALLIAYALLSVGTIVRIRGITADIVDRIVVMSHMTGVDPPVVVANMEAVGRLSWREAVDGGGYLRVTDSHDLGAVARALRREGIERFVFAAAHDPRRDRNRLEGYRGVGEQVTVHGWELTVMGRS
ncbi:MAG: hypothetical protein R2698_12485 [Microthrixaceae bacterium]